MATSASTRENWKTRNTLRATSRSTDAFREPSSASHPPAAKPSRNTSPTWKRSSRLPRHSRKNPPPRRTPRRSWTGRFLASASSVSSVVEVQYPTAGRAPLSTVRVTDADLVARARQGDPAAFGELIDRHRVAVYRAALAALGSHADAEDAVQDAFLAAYRRLDSFRGDASFKTWLLTIAWHHALNRRRSLVRMWRRMVEPALADAPAGTIGLSLLDQVPAFGPSPEQAAADGQLRRGIQQTIRALSPKLRDAFLLAQ